MKHLIENRPRLSPELTKQFDKQVDKTEVTLFAHGLVLVGLLVVNAIFGSDETDEVIDKS